MGLADPPLTGAPPSLICDDPIALLTAARVAHHEIEHWSETVIGDLVWEVAAVLYERQTAKELSELAVSETGMGSLPDTFERHRQRILGILRDMQGHPSSGVVDEDRERALRRYAKPVGVIAAMTPSTAAVAAVAVNALSALKTRNAVVFCPNPAAARTVGATVTRIRSALSAAGAPENLVQTVVTPSRGKAWELSQAADLVIAAGGRQTVSRALSGATPGYGGGAGNAVIIVDASADVELAAAEILRGKAFDHGTSCSAESCVLAHYSVQDHLCRAFEAHGGYVLNVEEARRLEDLVWPAGTLNRQLAGRSAKEIADRCGLSAPIDVKVLIAQLPSTECSFGREKLSPILGFGVFTDFDRALALAQELIAKHGPGHSCGIYTLDEQRLDRAARLLRVSRLMVNQSTGMGNSGSFANGMPFSVTLACGSWGGSTSTENVNWRHMLNYTQVSLPTFDSPPDPRRIFGQHWRRELE